MSVGQTVALFGGITLFNLLACLPVLLFSSVRRLFNQLPTENLIINYILGISSFTILHSVLLVALVVFSGGLEGVAVFWGLGGVTIEVALIAWIFASFLFPRLELWNPLENDDELDGRIALGLGLIWYTVSTGIGLFLLMVFLIAFFFPG